MRSRLPLGSRVSPGLKAPSTCVGASSERRSGDRLQIDVVRPEDEMVGHEVRRARSSATDTVATLVWLSDTAYGMIR